MENKLPEKNNFFLLDYVKFLEGALRPQNIVLRTLKGHVPSLKNTAVQTYSYGWPQ